MMNVSIPENNRSDVTAELGEERVWEFIDQILTDSLTRKIAKQHLAEGRNIELTALNIKQKLPQPDRDYQNTFLSKWSVSISQVIGTDIISPRLGRTQRPLPSQSVAQFAYKQAVLCLSCFAALELDAFLTNSPDDASRIFDLADQLQFAREEIV